MTVFLQQLHLETCRHESVATSDLVLMLLPTEIESCQKKILAAMHCMVYSASIIIIVFRRRSGESSRYPAKHSLARHVLQTTLACDVMQISCIFFFIGTSLFKEQ